MINISFATAHQEWQFNRMVNNLTALRQQAWLNYDNNTELEYDGVLREKYVQATKELDELWATYKV